MFAAGVASLYSCGAESDCCVDSLSSRDCTANRESLFSLLFIRCLVHCPVCRTTSYLSMASGPIQETDSLLRAYSVFSIASHSQGEEKEQQVTRLVGDPDDPDAEGPTALKKKRGKKPKKEKMTVGKIITTMTLVEKQLDQVLEYSQVRAEEWMSWLAWSVRVCDCCHAVVSWHCQWY